MTVIAALRIEGIPALISDFLITDERKDVPHFPLPTRPNMNDPLDAPLPRRISGMQRKCVIISDRFVVGFTGDVRAGSQVFAELDRRFGHRSSGPTLAELDLALRGFKLPFHNKRMAATVIGWTVQSRPCCFCWSARLG
jgi:hypothetical protein